MKKIRWVILSVSVLAEVFGILSLMKIAGVINPGFLSFYDSMRLILRYVIAIIFMTAGILSFMFFSNTFNGKLKNGLLILNCSYSSVLTLPLLYVFIGCFFAAGGTELFMVNEVTAEFQDIFGTNGGQYVIYVLGTVMSLVFIAVPILSTVMTIKKVKFKDLLKRKKAVLSSDGNNADSGSAQK